ncbi:TetR family transcriptional regulator [Rhizobium sp. FKY42]|uniref:TetR family transcriptional regulator n=1 Tax=Rhizobium sp. FKY42 TaxID=2562310 RepID=UPI0010BFD012|nr:TetR family transcriptional regulator [Rhizobium sp. FKY42]
MNDHSTVASETSRQDNVERILDCAERVFKHYGYSKTNVADIAKELSMSPANIYRFFASKADIHQAIARRMLSAQYDALAENAGSKASAADRLRSHTLLQHRLVMETMLDEQKVHEMVLVAIDQQWPVIEEHLTRVRGIIEEIIRDGIDAGEFRQQDARLAAECFMHAGVCLCHPQLVAKTAAPDEVMTPEALIEFAIQALR